VSPRGQGMSGTVVSSAHVNIQRFGWDAVGHHDEHAIAAFHSRRNIEVGPHRWAPAIYWVEDSKLQRGVTYRIWGKQFNGLS
jgi:hypothetical protein